MKEKNLHRATLIGGLVALAIAVACLLVSWLCAILDKV